ncbi:MAG: hypothetical protein EB127_03805 [Alphaproteobacteria bacterium]|nr:hypothetical protein [Alphaproteobacteria bacterium]
MFSFKDFISEDIHPVYILTDFENEQVDNILDTYHYLLNPDVLDSVSPEKYYKKKLLSSEYGRLANTLNLGKLRYNTSEKGDVGNVSVVVNFTTDIVAKAAYSEKYDTIEIFYYYFDKLSENQKRSAIKHELFHAKQEDKTLTPEYRRSINKRTLPNGNISIRSKRGYYFSENEFTVHVSTIIAEIDRQDKVFKKYIEQSEGTKKTFWEKQRQGFIKLLLQFIEGNLNIRSLPSYLKDEEDFIKTVYRNKNNPDMVQYYDFLRDRLHDKYVDIAQ